MTAKLLPVAPPGTDAAARACKGCGQPLSRHDTSGHRGGPADASEPGAPMPAIYEETVTAVFDRAIRNGQRLRHLCDTECVTSCPLPANRANC